MSKEATARSAMKLALEALENWVEYFPQNVDDIDKKAITSLREALAKPDFWEGYVPEPVKPAQQLVDCHATGVCVQSGLRAEQPAQQEPVAWTNWRELVGARHYRTPGWEMYADKRNPDDVALYTSPPAQRKPLTDEQIDAEFDAFASKFDHESNEWLDMGVDAYFRAGFKAAHGIKENT